ncbi:MAG: superoxide dismutase family protein [Euryhalocaulis sp.]|uniref:superoxide dismutase family protein n=1 Tax=Euryhalocaulis sp. TaxID=2744307 RepID=UPI0017F2E4B9|nr:superoxide dismutase family protein [Euryhalocaulis sp.]MBA4801300.1 superoxide dismutase family protein [Euryhalocaulis sp.]
MRRSILLLSAGMAAIALTACQDQQDNASDGDLNASDGQQEQGVTPGGDDAGSSAASNKEAALAGDMAVARADLQFIGDLPDASGQAEFFWDDRRLTMRVVAAGLPAGEHGIHLHETGDCSADDFTSAGGHIGKESAQHGMDNPEGPEAGDLHNLMVAPDGTADQTLNTRVLLQGDMGKRPKLLDADGSAVVIHEAPDDHTTQPIGGAGARIACGVIEGIDGAVNIRGKPVRTGAAETDAQ